MTKPSRRSASQVVTSPGQLRIIGGDWRGRKLQFPPLPGLRPSPDRVRETLFNWLAPVLAGAHCLDLFAGSGALGLEALSRGASSCRFVDAANAACRQIEAHLQTLKCERGSVVLADARAWLEQPPALPSRLDIVFLDPPFHQQLLAPCCAALERSGLLADDALIYLEAGVDEPLPALPDHWQLHRDKRAGQVAYRLFRRDGALSAPPGLG